MKTQIIQEPPADAPRIVRAAYAIRALRRLLGPEAWATLCLAQADIRRQNAEVFAEQYGDDAPVTHIFEGAKP